MCQGYGEEKMGAKKSSSCKECGGVGVFFAQMEQSHIWGLPKFIDFGTRSRIVYVRVLLIVLILGFCFLGYYFVSQLDFNWLPIRKFYGPNPV